MLNVIKFMAKRLRRRKRIKGTATKAFNRPGRNRPRGPTAQELWSRVYRFKETPAARAGTKRRIAREKAAKRKKFKLWG